MTKQEILDSKHVLRVERQGNVVCVTLKKGWFLTPDTPQATQLRRCNVILLPPGNLHTEYRLRFISKKEADGNENANDNDNDNFSPRRSRRIRSAKS